MPEEEIITSETLPDEGGQEAVNSDGASVSLKDLLSAELGKSFASDEDALKAVKDTFSYVGKKKDDIAKEVKEQLPSASSNEVAELTRRLTDLEFYKSKPEYEGAKDIIAALSKNGETPDKVIESKIFKDIWEKTKGYDEVQKSKSVLQSNPRLGQAMDKMTQAREASDKGDTNSARDSAIEAVREAFEI